MVFMLTKTKNSKEGSKQDRVWMSDATDRLKQESELLTQERERLQQRWSWTEVRCVTIQIPSITEHVGRGLLGVAVLNSNLILISDWFAWCRSSKKTTPIVKVKGWLLLSLWFANTIAEKSAGCIISRAWFLTNTLYLFIFKICPWQCSRRKEI